MPQVLTAVVRSVPARTKAKATIRRAAAPSFSRPAAARSCAEVISVRVIATAVIDVPLKAGSTSSQNFSDSGIPESNLPAVGIKPSCAAGAIRFTRLWIELVAVFDELEVCRPRRVTLGAFLLPLVSLVGEGGLRSRPD